MVSVRLTRQYPVSQGTGYGFRLFVNGVGWDRFYVNARISPDLRNDGLDTFGTAYGQQFLIAKAALPFVCVDMPVFRGNAVVGWMRCEEQSPWPLKYVREAGEFINSRVCRFRGPRLNGVRRDFQTFGQIRC